MARIGSEESLALTITGALPRWKVKSGRSTCGNTRINATKNNSMIRRAQRHGFMKNPPFSEVEFIPSRPALSIEVPRGRTCEYIQLYDRARGRECSWGKRYRYGQHHDPEGSECTQTPRR